MQEEARKDELVDHAERGVYFGSRKRMSRIYNLVKDEVSKTKHKVFDVQTLPLSKGEDRERIYFDEETYDEK